MSFLTRFYSNFPGGEMDLSNGNGSATESGGILTLSCTSSAICTWPTTSPRATKRFAAAAFDTVLKAETRCYGYTGSGNGGEWFTLFKDTGSGNSYYFGWWAADGRIYVGRNSVGNLANVVAASPSTNPHTYRVYWNPTSRPLFVEDEDASLTINPNQVQFWYRVGDAGTWALLHSRILDFTMPLPSLGMYISNASPYPSISAIYNYCGAYQWDAADMRFVPANVQIPLTNTSVDPKDVALLEDRVAILTQSGPTDPRLSDGQGGGLVLNDATPVVFEDQVQILTQSGPSVHTMSDGLDQGLSLRLDAAAFEDQVTWHLSKEPEFSTTTQDVDGHYHFIYPKPYLAVYCDATNDPWNNPTLNSFSGYARNGYKYTNGVPDAGPVSAPWRTEAPNAHRSSRPDFPVRSLIVVTRLELVIFDLDTFDGTVPSLRVWMRFLLGNDGSTFYALGRGIESIRSIAFANGQLIVGTRNTGWEVGRVHSVDFKALTPATVYSLVGFDNQWVGTGTKTIVDRNTTSIFTTSGSVRINSKENHCLAVYVSGTNTLYVAVSGENVSPDLLTYVGGALQSGVRASGEDCGGDDLGNYRQVLFDDVGWFWFSVGSRIYRNCTDWREGHMRPDVKDERQGQIDLGTRVTQLVAAKESIYAGTVKGVYRIHKGSLKAYLAYTAPGGGGRGRLNAPGSGELLAGTNSEIQSLMTYTLLLGSTVVPYLSIGTYFSSGVEGGYTLIRLWDDVVVKTYTVPNLIEPGTYISPALLV